MKIPPEIDVILIDVAIVLGATVLLLTAWAAIFGAWRLLTAIPRVARGLIAGAARDVSGVAPPKPAPDQLLTAQNQWARVMGVVAGGLAAAQTLGGLQSRATEHVDAASYRLTRTLRDLTALRRATEHRSSVSPSFAARRERRKAAA